MMNNFLTKRKEKKIRGKLDDEFSLEIQEVSHGLLSGAIAKKKIKDAVGDLVQITSLSTASGSVGTANGIRLTSTLSSNNEPYKVLLGICEVTAYEDNAGQAASIIPYGSNAIAGGYKVHAAHDYHRNEISSRPGAGITYVFHILNETGSTHTVYFYIRWRYVGMELESS